MYLFSIAAIKITYRGCRRIHTNLPWKKDFIICSNGKPRALTAVKCSVLTVYAVCSNHHIEISLIEQLFWCSNIMKCSNWEVRRFCWYWYAALCWLMLLLFFVYIYIHWINKNTITIRFQWEYKGHRRLHSLLIGM